MYKSECRNISEIELEDGDEFLNSAFSTTGKGTHFILFKDCNDFIEFCQWSQSHNRDLILGRSNAGRKLSSFSTVEDYAEFIAQSHRFPFGITIIPNAHYLFVTPASESPVGVAEILRECKDYIGNTLSYSAEWHEIDEHLHKFKIVSNLNFGELFDGG